mgnify:FL=1|tara:strand:- start:129 stop:557 length:429 start_codon:yes stop_codon:yes gene_type:complete
MRNSKAKRSNPPTTKGHGEDITMGVNTMEFNTGREYSEHGQRIAVKVMDTKPCPVFGSEMTLIMLIDRDRGMEGWMEVFQVDQYEIMDSYDRHQWASHSRFESLWGIDGPARSSAMVEFHKEISEPEHHTQQTQDDDFSPGM